MMANRCRGRTILCGLCGRASPADSLQEDLMRDSAHVPRRFTSRIAAAILACAGLLVLPGCWVYSVNPLYENKFLAKLDPDLTFDQTLVGSWWIADKDCPWIVTIAASQQTYDLTMAPSPQCKSEEKTSKYQGHLVKLDNHVFLDLAPGQDEVCDSCLALHQIFLAQIEKNSFALTPINYDWLKKSIEQKTLIIQTLPDRPEVLTASSKELKDFMRKYADDKSAFQPAPDFIFKRR
jgi:hypothetical protein